MRVLLLLVILLQGGILLAAEPTPVWEHAYYGWQLGRSATGGQVSLLAVTPGGPAAVAGLEVGDHLLQVGSVALLAPGLGPPGRLEPFLAAQPPGAWIPIRYERAGNGGSTVLTPVSRAAILARIESATADPRELAVLLVDLVRQMVGEAPPEDQLQEHLLRLAADAGLPPPLRRRCLNLLGGYCDRAHLQALRELTLEAGSLRQSQGEAVIRAEDRLGLLAEGLDDLERVLRWIRERYVAPERVPVERLTGAAMRGMLESLDSYSELLTPEQARLHRRHQYGGIGVSVESRDGHHLVLRVFPGPARDRLFPDDEILSVDGQPMVGEDRELLTRALRGSPGEPVTMKIRRPGLKTVPLELRLVREAIQRPVVSSASLPGAIGYLRLHSFSTGSHLEVARAVSALVDAGDQALILDLRGNRGGAVVEVKRIASIFLGPDHLVCFSQGRDGFFPRREVYTGSATVRWEGCLVTLVDQESASAAEMLAGALSCNGRSQLVGQRTFGKGIGQSTYPLDSALGRRLVKLTTFNYYLPDGTSIHQEGVAPDLEVATSHGDEELLLAYHRLRRAGAFRRYLQEYLGHRPEDPIPLGAATFFSGPRDPDLRFPRRREWYAALEPHLTGGIELTLEEATEGLRRYLRLQAEHTLMHGGDLGQSFACDLEGDRQLQAAIQEVARQQGIDLHQVAAYAHFLPEPETSPR